MRKNLWLLLAQCRNYVNAQTHRISLYLFTMRLVCLFAICCFEEPFLHWTHFRKITTTNTTHKKGKDDVECFSSFFDLSFDTDFFFVLLLHLCILCAKRNGKMVVVSKLTFKMYTWIIGLCSFSQKVNSLFSYRRKKKRMKKECRSWNLNGTKKEREKGWEGERADSEPFFHIYVKPKFTYWKNLYSTSNYILKNIVQSNRCWRVCKHFGFCFSFNDTFACEVFGIFLYVFNGKS